MRKLIEVQRRLEAIRAEHAAGVLMAPGDRSEYGFGHAAGLFQGLTKAIEEIEHSISVDEDADDADR